MIIDITRPPQKAEPGSDCLYFPGTVTISDQLWAEIIEILYSPSARVGYVFMESGCCVDFPGTLEFFEERGLPVDRIETWAGDVKDTEYVFDFGDWIALLWDSYHARGVLEFCAV